MWRLSNFTGHGNGAVDPAGVQYRPARPNQQWEALSLVLAQHGTAATDQQVEDFLAFSRTKELCLDDIWIAESNGQIYWAIFPVIAAGKTLLMLGPDGVTPPPAIAGRLIDEICVVFAKREIHLAQALLNVPDSASRALYESHSFRQMAELLYLSRQFRKAAPMPQLPAGMELRTYSPAEHPHFAAAISSSYAQSMDCPGLNGLRDIEDVITGHKTTGAFDPELWFVLLEHDDPRAVLLLSRMLDAEGMELVYLGLCPKARGKGVGDYLMNLAAHQMGMHQRSRLTLAVDSRNAPALALYYRHGLQKLGSKIAMMRDLRRGKGQGARGE